MAKESAPQPSQDDKDARRLATLREASVLAGRIVRHSIGEINAATTLEGQQEARQARDASLQTLNDIVQPLIGEGKTASDPSKSGQ